MSTGKAQANFVINIIWHILAAGERVVVISSGLNNNISGHNKTLRIGYQDTRGEKTLLSTLSAFEQCLKKISKEILT